MKKFIVMSLITVGSFISPTHIKNAGHQKIFTVAHAHPDTEILARLIYAEAGGESFKGQCAVADVVIYISEELNWSVKRTIMESGLFDGIHSIMFDLKRIPHSCTRAAKRALSGHHVLPDGMLYFYNPATATDTLWINQLSKNRVIRIGNHVFCCRQRRMV